MITEGEWVYHPKGESYINPKLPELYRGEICSDEQGLTLCVMVSDCLLDQVEANAHLIAAAPDMYEALKKATTMLTTYLSAHSEDEILRTLVEICKKALLKAEGK